MNPRYIILLGKKPRHDSDASSLLASRLRAEGMTCLLESSRIRLFASPDTPVLTLPGRGLLVGHLFTRNHEPVSRYRDVHETTNDLVRHLLQNAWGQYLAVLVDDAGSTLSLLRDPSGAVPCVHSLDHGEGFVTSDASLAACLGLHQREIDWSSIAHSLNFPHLKTTRTAFRQLDELLPGNLLTCRADTTSIIPAWSPWDFVKVDVRHADPVEAAHDVRVAVSGVVEALSRGDDTPVAELSGGLDSSIVAACLGRATTRALFCTLVMPVAGTDERPYARMVTEALGQPLLAVKLDFEDVQFKFDVPRSSVLPVTGILQHAANATWEAVARSHGASRFFSGAGGDSIFCYLKTAAPAADAFIERGATAGLEAVRNLAELHQCTLWRAGKLAWRQLRGRSSFTWKADTTLLANDGLVAKPRCHPWLDAPRHAMPGDRAKIRDLVATQLFLDAGSHGPDRTMHFPLLSQPVIEACLKVPSWMWIQGGRNRAIARDAFADMLPPGIIERRSKGSYTGYLAAVHARSQQAMRQFLEEGLLCSQGIVDRQALAGFFQRKLAPRDISFLRIFDLCAVENWVRQQIQ